MVSQVVYGPPKRPRSKEGVVMFKNRQNVFFNFTQVCLLSSRTICPKRGSACVDRQHSQNISALLKRCSDTRVTA